jgi:hypothetical protein
MMLAEDAVRIVASLALALSAQLTLFASFSGLGSGSARRAGPKLAHRGERSAEGFRVESGLRRLFIGGHQRGIGDVESHFYARSLHAGHPMGALRVVTSAPHCTPGPAADDQMFRCGAGS